MSSARFTSGTGSAFAMTYEVGEISKHVDVGPEDVETNLENEMDWKMVLTSKNRIGMPLSYLVVGFIYGSATSLVYPVYNVYLQANSSTINTMNSLVTLSFNLKVFYGFVSDSVPIFGQRRRPYLIIGWIFTFCATLATALYLYFGSSKEYCFPAFGARTPADSPECAGLPTYHMPDFDELSFGMFLLMQNLAYMFADVSMDSLSIEWAVRENVESRGQIQSNNYSMRALGFVMSAAFIGFGLNYAPFGGSFERGVPLYMIFVVQCIVMIIPFPFYYFLLEDTYHEHVPTIKEQCKSVLTLLSSKAYGFLILFALGFGLCLYTTSVGQSNVPSVWIQMAPVINGVNNVWSNLVMTLTLYLCGRFLRNISWRIVQSLSVIFNVLVGLLYIPIVYNITRNEWYYIFVNMNASIVSYIGYMVCLWACNELTIPGLEGTAFALTSTATNVVLTIGTVYITNSLGSIYPDLETLTGPNVQHDYMMNYMMVSLINLTALVFLPLLPRQKDHAQERKSKWGTSRKFGIALVCLSSLLIVFSLVTTLGSMICPNAKFFGGPGNGC